MLTPEKQLEIIKRGTVEIILEEDLKKKNLKKLTKKVNPCE